MIVKKSNELFSLYNIPTTGCKVTIILLLHTTYNNTSLQITFSYKAVICQARDKVWPDMQPPFVFLKWKNIFFISRHNGRAQSTCPVRLSIRQSKPSNLPDKCPMSGANLQAWFLWLIFTVYIFVNFKW